MRLKINTGEFKDMVSKVIKGASSDKNAYITQLMSIELKDNVLTLTTTDTNNYLYIKKDKVAYDGDGFYAVVPVDKFSKLISKLTCDEVTLETKFSDKGELDKLIVKGNGSYTIELPYDEDGELVEFPDPLSDDDSTWSTAEVKLSTIHLLLTTAKASLAQTQDRTSPYTGYYAGDKVVTSDSFKICGIDIKLFDEPKLIPSEVMDLLDVVQEENIEVRYNDSNIIFSTSTVDVYGSLKDSIGEFKIDAISALLEEPFGSSCVVDKSDLLQTLDRLALFVGVNDKNGVYVTFTKKGINISTKREGGDEIIPYIISNNFTEYTCCIDIKMLIQQVKANMANTIEIFYGKESTLKLVDGSVTQIIALADDEREDE